MTNNYWLCVSLDTFIDYTVGEIYHLAPYHKPRFIDEIVDEIITRFKIGCKQIGRDFFYHEIELKDLRKFIESILMPIDKFRDLNLSQNEYEQGISVDDESRPKFHFSSAYNSTPEADDFVDLDACIGNIFCKYEHSAYRDWMYGEDGLKDLDKLLEFRKLYREKNDGGSRG